MNDTVPPNNDALTAPKPASKSRRRMILILVGVLVVVAAGVTAFLLTRPKVDDSTGSACLTLATAQNDTMNALNDWEAAGRPPAPYLPLQQALDAEPNLVRDAIAMARGGAMESRFQNLSGVTALLNSDDTQETSVAFFSIEQTLEACRDAGVDVTIVHSK